MKVTIKPLTSSKKYSSTLSTLTCIISRMYISQKRLRLRCTILSSNFQAALSRSGKKSRYWVSRAYQHCKQKKNNIRRPILARSDQFKKLVNRTKEAQILPSRTACPSLDANDMIDQALSKVYREEQRL